MGANNEEWVKKFRAETCDLATTGAEGYKESANRLRRLVRTGLLKSTDLQDNPERFFLAHRVLAQYAPRLNPGFWVRFTVHHNLCGGTVVALGSDEQVREHMEGESRGLLGCFGLTEKLAGVSSGLVVETTADYDVDSQTFTINTPTPGATKNWISQGLVADKCVVIADLRIAGKSYGPHGFIVELRKNGEVTPGVVHGDMGKKTVGNDLDNAWIAFDKLKVPKAALLNRFADIEGAKYVQKVKGLPVFHMIGQRLFTGRVAVAQAALEFRRSIFEQTKRFTDQKECWTPTGTRPLSSVPQLKRLYERHTANQALLDEFVGKCERELADHLRNKTLPTLELVEAIAAAKVKCVEDSIHYVHVLQNEVGSYALMRGTGFEQTDFLTCCKFAEGDSRILMQKMARDRVRIFKKKEADLPDAQLTEEQKLCKQLAADESDFEVQTKLAETIIARTVSTFLGQKANL
eukprot:TRINITY_DN3336_c0_g1_i2.p1 TRINITY_DN3336_c0_g1~~TRINITY_DN3336_c0_g1_i2.p1  ORF type:complete len:463 (+),score=204.66 TRINITY_DN3336_c0_g1_i2:50-1438(+)